MLPMYYVMELNCFSQQTIRVNYCIHQIQLEDMCSSYELMTVLQGILLVIWFVWKVLMNLLYTLLIHKWNKAIRMASHSIMACQHWLNRKIMLSMRMKWHQMMEWMEVTMIFEIKCHQNKQWQTCSSHKSINNPLGKEKMEEVGVVIWIAIVHWQEYQPSLLYCQTMQAYDGKYSGW